MYHVSIAYLLWLVGGLGTLGFHRFYLKKVPTGVLWLVSGGLVFVGAAYDFFTLARQVQEANGREGNFLARAVEVTVKREKEPLERVILRMAEKHGGRVSPVLVAASSDWSVDESQKHLDEMVRRGLCELKVLKNGTLVYLFSEFDPNATKEFEV